MTTVIVLATIILIGTFLLVVVPAIRAIGSNMNDIFYAKYRQKALLQQREIIVEPIHYRRDIVEADFRIDLRRERDMWMPVEDQRRQMMYRLADKISRHLIETDALEVKVLTVRDSPDVAPWEERHMFRLNFLRRENKIEQNKYDSPKFTSELYPKY